MPQKLNQNLIFFFLSELICYGLAMEVEPVDIVRNEKKDMHHIIFKQIRQQNLLSEPE